MPPYNSTRKRSSYHSQRIKTRQRPIEQQEANQSTRNEAPRTNKIIVSFKPIKTKHRLTQQQAVEEEININYLRFLTVTTNASKIYLPLTFATMEL